MKHDDFGDRMKAYESAFTSTKLDPSKYMCVRIDGRGFSKFTKGFKKPFDGHMTNVMVSTMKSLVKETHASVGYTQSDEITLIFAPNTGRIFGGKVSKINSVFASMVTAHFNLHLQATYPAVIDKLAYFDCRVWDVPDDVEASNVLLWRVQDARKNSVSSLFRWTAGHKAMNKLDQLQMKEYLLEHHACDWNALPNFWKYGTYAKPIVYESYLTAEELQNIPEGKKPVDILVKRSKIENVNIGYFGDLSLEARKNFVH